MSYFLRLPKARLRCFLGGAPRKRVQWKRGVGLAAGISIVFAGAATAQPADSFVPGKSFAQPPARLTGQRVSQLDRSALGRPELAQATALTDLSRFPLFLPSSVGLLTASSDRLSPRRISSPSLVWVQDKLGDRYGSDRLVEQWRAYSVSENGSPLNYVDVIVNQRIWGLLSYFERYSFISQFGAAAESYGYNLRIFHTGDVANFNDSDGASSADFVALRGAYLCPFDAASLPAASDTVTNLSCEVLFDSSSRRPLLDSPLR